MKPGFLAGAIGSLLLSACLLQSVEVAQGGSGSESTNGNIVGRVFAADGQPAANATVLVRSADYLRDTSKTAGDSVTPDAVTDSEGRFHLDSLKRGSYEIEVRDGSANAALIGAQVWPDSTIDIAPATLRPVGVLQGTLAVTMGSPGRLFVQIYGMERLARCDSSGAFLFKDLPIGPLQIKAVSPVPDQAYNVTTVHIQSGGTVTLNTLAPRTFASEDYARWPFSRKVFLNTLAAGVKTGVKDFPVLLRLDSTKFDFNGADIKSVRFAASDGTRLHYEVESWDPQERRATIWVRVDSLKGGSQDDYMTMYWGNYEVPDFSDGPGVFSEFAGVWHLQLPPPKESSSRFLDASPSHAEGTAPGPWTSFHDIIGRSLFFVGGQYVSVPAGASLKSVSRLSLSGWSRSKEPPTGTADGSDVNPALDTAGRDIVALGLDYGLRIAGDGTPYCYLLADSTYTGSGGTPKSAWKIARYAGRDWRDDKWHLFAAVYDGEYLRLYVDGQEKAKTAYSGPVVHPIPGGEVSIGRSLSPGGKSTLFRYFDEVRISGEAWSPARVLADYLTQKPGAKLAEFR